jgi:hypothetical protein
MFIITLFYNTLTPVVEGSKIAFNPYRINLFLD